MNVKDRLGPAVVGYQRNRSPTDYNPSFIQRRRYESITGCRAFSVGLRAVRWPDKFRSFNRLIWISLMGVKKTLDFLQTYTTAIQAAGGGAHVMANYLLTLLKGYARSWLLNQPPESIYA